MAEPAISTHDLVKTYGRGSRAVAPGTAGVAVAGYLANSVITEAQSWSPVHWYMGGSPIVNGIQWGGATALAITTVVLALAGTFLLTRRDLNAG